MYTMFTMSGSKTKATMYLHRSGFTTLGPASVGTKRSIDIKMERQLHDMQISGKIMEVRSTEQFVWYPKKLLHFFLQVL